MAAMTVSSSRTMRRSKGVLASCLAALLACWAFPRIQHAFSCPSYGLKRKQARGVIHNKDTLRPPVEVPLDEEEPEPAVKSPMPERRVPYTMHIVSQFPQHKHLHEDSTARKFIEGKLTHSLENFENMIRHVEVHVQVSENFHREMPKHGEKHASKTKGSAREAEDEDGVTIDMATSGKRMLMPYIIKASVSLNNHHTINLANPEKHAQASLQEAVDHMIDVLRKSLRMEKEKSLDARMKESKMMLPEEDDDDALDMAASIAEEQFEQDTKDQELYARVESS